MAADHVGLAQLMDQAYSSYGGAVLVAADQAKIVPLLVDHPEGLTDTEVADALGLHPQITPHVLLALHHLGVLEVSGEKYRAGELATRHLDPRKPPYFGTWMQFLHAGCWSKMGQLGDYLTGRQPLPETLYEPSNELVKFMLDGVHPLSTSVAEALVDRVDLSETRRLLDVGGGTAAFTITVLNAVPQARATVTDQAFVVDITRSYVDKAGLGDRVAVVAADLFVDDLPTGYDTVLVNNVFHAWDTDRRALGLAKCYESLISGGTLYICEHVLDDSPNQVLASVGSLMLMTQTGQGSVFRLDDFTEALAKAGFADVVATPFPDQPMCSHILSGRKP